MGDVRKNYVSRKRMNRCINNHCLIRRGFGKPPMKNSSFTTEEKKGPLGKPQRILKKPFFVLFAKRTTEYLVFKKKIVSLHPIKRTLRWKIVGSSYEPSIVRRWK